MKISNTGRRAGKFRVVLLGLGTVGGAVLRLLETRYKRAWNIEIAAVMSRGAREISLPVKAQIFDSWCALHSALEAEKSDADSKAGAARKADGTDSSFSANAKLGAIDAVIELIGGVDACLPIYQYFLRRGIPLVTANKALLAECGAELFMLAQQHNTFIACEASCGGGIPIIDALLHGLRANYIDEFHGILNGTCNFILSKMAGEGCPYGEALAEAQREGLAEAEPHLDVSGTDMAHKLAILAMLAFGRSLKLEVIQAEGIEHLTPAHIRAGEKLGLSLKLLASAWHLESGGVALRVGPCFIRRQNGLVCGLPPLSPSPLASVEGCFNGIVFYGDAVGRIYLEGRGAGGSATASAVLSDLCQLQNGSYAAAFADFPYWPGAQILRKGPEEDCRENGWGKLPHCWLVFVHQGAAAWQSLARQRGIDAQMILEEQGITIFIVRRGSAQQLELLHEAFCRAFGRSCGGAEKPIIKPTAIPILEPPQERLFGDSNQTKGID